MDRYPEILKLIPRSPLQAFIMSAQSGFLRIIIYLNPQIEDEFKGTAFIVASEFGHNDIIQFLARFLPRDTPNFGLIPAIQNGFLETVELLSDLGANLRYDYDSALETAGVYGCPKIVKFLLDNGAPISANIDYNPVIEAAINGQNEKLRILLNRNPNQRVVYQALRSAIDNNQTETVDFLLKLVRPDLEDNFLRGIPEEISLETFLCLKDHNLNLHFDEEYLLVRFVIFERIDIVRILLEDGAYVRTNNDKPLMIAIYNKDPEMIDLLRSC